MNGFIVRPLAAALSLAATAPALPACAHGLSRTLPVSLTVLPGAQTVFDARGPAGARFAVTDEGGLPVDLTDVHVYVRQDGSDRRCLDARSAEAAILAARRTSDGPVVVTLVF